jgi:sugar/nucleoside kinase (ribokinase family)
MDGKMYRDNLDIFRRSRMTLIGYYSLMPTLQNDLADVLAQIRGLGCLTALDAAGDGGTMDPLSQILPHLDIYIPSLAEAAHQTGESDPQKIIDIYRKCGAPGLLGVKLGSEGALLSPKAGEYAQIDCVPLPGPIVDTTGAGDSFYAGVLTGLIKGMDAAKAGRLGAAAGACCITGMGASAGLRNFESTAKLANLNL